MLHRSDANSPLMASLPCYGRFYPPTINPKTSSYCEEARPLRFSGLVEWIPRVRESYQPDRPVVCHTSPTDRWNVI